MKKATDRPQGHNFGMEIPINNPLQLACNVTHVIEHGTRVGLGEIAVILCCV